MISGKLLVALAVGTVLTHPGVRTVAAQQLVADPALEEALIEQAVRDLYVRGLRTRDFDLIRSVCLPEAVLMGVRTDGSLTVTTLDDWSQRFDPANPPFRQLHSSIVKIDREGAAAQVKLLLLVDGETHITDFLQMLKVDGKWRITGIIDY